QRRNGFRDVSTCMVIRGVDVEGFAVLVDYQLRNHRVAAFGGELLEALRQATCTREEIHRAQGAGTIYTGYRLRASQVRLPPRALRVVVRLEVDDCVDHGRPIDDDSAVYRVTIDGEGLAFFRTLQTGQVERLLDAGHIPPSSSPRATTRSRSSPINAAASSSS